MELPKAYDPKQVEGKIYKLWEESGFFNPDKLPKRNKKPYTIMIAPPNVTGSLHMGHALENTVSDILIRFHRMKGFKTLWLPGTDHAGIATQRVVEKELKKEGKTRFDLGREKFIEKVWEWRKIYGNIILDQLKKLGASCDWSRTRFTMDDGYKKAVEAAFLHYHKKGLIYQGERTVNWCAKCGTSLSDLEVEYEEESSFLYYIKYGPLTVVTVRPETKLGDTAIAVNPKDVRYKEYIGRTVDIKTVLGPAKMKVIGDESVDMNFGTGAMKVTPAHDLHDFELGEKHGLEKKQVIGPDGRMTKLAGKYAGLNVMEAREKIIEDMKEIGILEKVEPYKHNIAKCYRCNSVLEPILSKQWFLKMRELAKSAIKAVKSGKVKFIPQKWQKPYFDWLENIKDWCISRQIWWGHQLPVFEKQEEIRSTKSEIRNNLKIKNSKLKIYVGDNPPRDYMQVPDVLDTWFSSALWPFAALGWPQKTKSDLETFYPADFITSAREIINLWIARMIFSGFEFMKKEPFKNYYIHPTVLTREGKRMSKSLGTGIDPVILIEKYGADAARLGIAYQLMGGQDIKFVEDNIVMGRKFCNKLWNASRFVLMQIAGKSDFLKTPGVDGETPGVKTRKSDFLIIEKLNKTIKSVNKDLENYRFGEAAHTLYDFFWHDFCDKFIEESKGKNDEKTNSALLHVLLNSLKLLHPFIPFITEEIYQQLPIHPVKSAEGGAAKPQFNGVKNKKESLMVEEWPQII